MERKEYATRLDSNDKPASESGRFYLLGHADNVDHRGQRQRRAGLDFAISTGLEHGGFVPRGRKAEAKSFRLRGDEPRITESAPLAVARSSAGIIYIQSTLAVQFSYKKGISP
jgi:hypothetical protein